eukprot:jgi/Chlat1/4140/Chrsp269S00293
MASVASAAVVSSRSVVSAAASTSGRRQSAVATPHAPRRGRQHRSSFYGSNVSVGAVSIPTSGAQRCWQPVQTSAVLEAERPTDVAASPLTDVKKRVSTVHRKTKETSVEVTINLDGTGECIADTGIPFLDHMIDQLSSHGLFDLVVRAQGDTHIDDHHTNEDIALALGQALANALGDRKGIHRFGDFSAPLDEALVHVVLDLSGRPHMSHDLNIPTSHVGKYDTQLVEHFFQSLANTSGMTLHIRQLAGRNSHHIIEATFKAFARALRRATEVDPRRAGTIPSSKGVLTQQ